MTAVRRSSLGGMLRHGVVLLCLLAAALATTATVHAREMERGSVLACSGKVDGQEETGTATPHHHENCQGVAGFIPACPIATQPAATVPYLPFIYVAKNSTDWSFGPNLKPPIA